MDAPGKPEEEVVAFEAFGTRYTVGSRKAVMNALAIVIIVVLYLAYWWTKQALEEEEHKQKSAVPPAAMVACLYGP